MGGQAVASVDDERSAIAALKDGALQPGRRQAAGLSGEECSALVSLLIEADSFISHMRHRGSWPSARDDDTTEVDALIGRLRRAS